MLMFLFHMYPLVAFNATAFSTLLMRSTPFSFIAVNSCTSVGANNSYFVYIARTSL